ncbi:MAG TPA: ABC transporter ATP-binding protein [Gemmatimonadales bacterium]|jgi:ATP-binding cassette subfamily B protein|nr:ABC transporter ATP-binding protein [Gemmatimonadales bacterium]
MTAPKPSLRRLLDPSPLREGLRLVWQSAPGWTLLQMGLLLVSGAVPLAALYLTKRIVDAVAGALAGGGRDLGAIAGLIALAGLVALAGAALRALTTLVGEVQSLRLGDRVQDVLHAKSVEVDLEYYENSDYYDTLHNAQEQAPYRPARIVTGLGQVGLGGLSLLAVTGLLVSFHWLLVAILFGAALPGIFIKTRHSSRLYEYTHRRTPAMRRARYLTLLLTTIEYAKEIRLFDLGGVLRSRFRDLRRQVTRERIDLAVRRTAGDLLGQTVALVAVFGSLYFVAARAVAGAISLGDMVMYFGAFQRAQDFFRDLLAGLASLYEDNLFLADFKKFVDLRPAVADPPAPRRVPRPLRRGLSFEGVTFRYPGTGRDVLREVSFDIRPGEHVALVGENGSGKTTLVKLLCRLYDPTAGAIRLDGLDLREFAVRDLRTELAVVFQDYARYHLTARENIWAGNVALPPDSERVVEAARRTGADAVIQALPQGYETLLGRQYEKGADLSLGEWQKLALARAFLRESQIIVLDEPTAALDPRAEAEVFERFHELARGRTAILISHRLSTVRTADRILVLADGRIVEAGPHDELVGREGLYARLFETQARPYR